MAMIARSEFTNLSYVWYILDDLRSDGLWYQTLGKPIELARGFAYHRGEEKKRRLFELLKEEGANVRRVHDEYRIGPRLKLTMSEIVGLHMLGNAGVSATTRARRVEVDEAVLEANKHQRESLLESNISEGIDVAALDAVAEFVRNNPEAQALQRALSRHFEELFSLAATAYNKQTGKTLNYVDGYFAIMRKDGDGFDSIMGELENAIASIAPDADEIGLGQPTAVRQRRGTFGSTINFDAMDVAYYYSDKITNYSEKIAVITKTLAVLNTTRLKRALTRRLGGDEGFIKALNTMVKREMYPSGRTEAVKNFEKVLRPIRTHFNASILMFRVATMLKQLPSMLAFMGELPSLRHNFTPMMGNMLSVFKMMVYNGRFGGGSTHLLEGHPALEAMRRFAPQLLVRFADPDLQDLDQRGWRKGFGSIKVNKWGMPDENGKPIGVWGTAGIRNVDMFVVASSWYTAFEYIKGVELAKGNVSQVEAEHRAAAEASRIIRETQPPSTVFERTMWQTGSEWKRALTPFSGQLFNYYQLYTNKIIKPVYAAVKQGDAGLLKKELTQQGLRGEYNTAIWQKALFSAVLPSMVMGYFFRRRLPEEEEWWADILLFPLMSVPVLGPLLANRIMYGWRDIEAGSIYGDIVTSIVRPIGDVATLDVGKQTFIDTFEAVAVWQRLPQTFVKLVEVVGGQLQEDPEEWDSDEFFKAMSMPIAPTSAEEGSDELRGAFFQDD